MDNVSFILSHAIPKLTQEQVSDAVAKQDWDILVRSQIPLVVSMTRKYDDFDTALSIGLLALSRSVQSYIPGGKTTLTGYCKWAIHRRLWNWIKRQESFEGEEVELISHDTHSLEAADLVAKLLPTLSPRQLEITKFVMAGVSHPEIAQRLDISPQSSRQMYSNGLARMRESVRRMGLTA